MSNVNSNAPAYPLRDWERAKIARHRKDIVEGFTFVKYGKCFEIGETVGKEIVLWEVRLNSEDLPVKVFHSANTIKGIVNFLF